MQAAPVSRIFMPIKALSPIVNRGTKNGFASTARPALIQPSVRIASEMLRRNMHQIKKECF